MIDNNKINAILAEKTRLLKMEQLNLLDGREEEAFNRLTRFAVKLLNVPAAFLSLVTPTKQVFKSVIGMPEPYQTRKETPITMSYCKYVVIHNEPLIINDARTHELVKENLAIPELNAISYIGIPIEMSDGTVLGSFCVADDKPREWTQDEIDTVTDLAQAVITEIDLRAELLAHENAQARIVTLAVEKESMALLSAFVRDSTHEFKTPISTIKTKAYLMGKMVGEDERLQDYLDEINTQADRINQLVDSLVTLTRLDQMGSFDFNKGSINDSLTIVHEKVVDHLAEKSITFTLDLDDSLPIIAYDNETFTIAISAIVHNAIQHVPAGKGEITLKSSCADDTITIQVIDNGYGIPLDQLPHIFDRFYRHDRAHSTAGFGLGLTIAKKIIEQHKGTISVNSHPDNGTTFTITIPIG